MVFPAALCGGFFLSIAREFIDSLRIKSLSVNHEHPNDEPPLRSDED